MQGEKYVKYMQKGAKNSQDICRNTSWCVSSRSSCHQTHKQDRGEVRPKYFIHLECLMSYVSSRTNSRSLSIEMYDFSGDMQRLNISIFL